MKKGISTFGKRIRMFWRVVNRHHTGAYAAQAAFFFVLSFIPMLFLLVTMIQFTPITQEDLIYTVGLIFPATVEELILSTLYNAYNQSSRIIPITIIITLWSACRGVLTVGVGLNQAYSRVVRRNYFFSRLRAMIYTLLFLLVIILSLVVSVFGNSIRNFIEEQSSLAVPIVEHVLEIRMILGFLILTVFWIFLYRFLPNRQRKSGIVFRYQLPGAMFTAFGWLLLSYFFSIYLDIFTGFTTMYGSLTTVILLLLWVYFCMYIILLGGEINAVLEDKWQPWYLTIKSYMLKWIKIKLPLGTNFISKSDDRAQ